eukprot:scaffold14974_cov195-Amphora_coffeaeformis.AAC.6
MYWSTSVEGSHIVSVRPRSRNFFDLHGGRHQQRRSKLVLQQPHENIHRDKMTTFRPVDDSNDDSATTAGFPFTWSRLDSRSRGQELLGFSSSH